MFLFCVVVMYWISKSKREVSNTGLDSLCIRILFWEYWEFKFKSIVGATVKWRKNSEKFQDGGKHVVQSWKKFKMAAKATCARKIQSRGQKFEISAKPFCQEKFKMGNRSRHSVITTQCNDVTRCLCVIGCICTCMLHVHICETSSSIAPMASCKIAIWKRGHFQ